MLKPLIHTALALALLGVPAMVGCQSLYYGTLEKFGYEKRDVLVDRVEDARDKQEDAKEQFTSALEQFKSVVNFDGGDMEDLYTRLEKDYKRSKRQAARVSDQIESVEAVADALFSEWESELDEFTDPKMRADSESMLRNTQRRYERMLGAMRRAESTMDPVLDSMNNQVLYLKHNLNAQAIASIQGSASEIEQDIERLIREMEQSISEANAFIDQMSS